MSGDFATGSRFNRPDQINSTMMSIPPGYGRQVWTTFVGYRSMVMRSFGGDSRLSRIDNRPEDQALAGHVSGPIGQL